MYKVGDLGSVNGRECKVIKTHESGPLVNLLFVEFSSGTAGMRHAYVSKKDFIEVEDAKNWLDFGR